MPIPKCVITNPLVPAVTFLAKLWHCDNWEPLHRSICAEEHTLPNSDLPAGDDPPAIDRSASNHNEGPLSYDIADISIGDRHPNLAQGIIAVFKCVPPSYSRAGMHLLGARVLSRRLWRHPSISLF